MKYVYTPILHILLFHELFISFTGTDVNYRYDGLYRVVKVWTSTGLDHSFHVFKFALVRLEGQPDLPIREDLVEEEKE